MVVVVVLLVVVHTLTGLPATSRPVFGVRMGTMTRLG